MLWKSYIGKAYQKNNTIIFNNKTVITPRQIPNAFNKHNKTYNMQYKQNKKHATPIQLIKLQVQEVIKHSTINNSTGPDKINIEHLGTLYHTTTYTSKQQP